MDQQRRTIPFCNCTVDQLLLLSLSVKDDCIFCAEADILCRLAFHPRQQTGWLQINSLPKSFHFILTSLCCCIVDGFVETKLKEVDIAVGNLRQEVNQLKLTQSGMFHLTSLIFCLSFAFLLLICLRDFYFMQKFCVCPLWKTLPRILLPSLLLGCRR